VEDGEPHGTIVSIQSATHKNYDALRMEALEICEVLGHDRLFRRSAPCGANLCAPTEACKGTPASGVTFLSLNRGAEHPHVFLR
jgi:hypothetical protein